MNQWLDTITADHSHRPLQVKIRMDKPTGLTDGCFLNGTFVHENLTYTGHGACARQFPAFADPRLVAGEPLAENVLKCQLKPLNFSDYPVTFTLAEQAELRSAFPTGVCDYHLPGVGQQPPRGTWLSYGNSSGG